MSDDTLPDIPPEVPDAMRRRLERTWREYPERFSAELQIALNILAREPKTYQPREWPEAPGDESGERFP